MIRNYAPHLYKKFELQYKKNGSSVNSIETESVGLLRKPVKSAENSLDPTDRKNAALDYWSMFREARDQLKAEKGDS